MVRVNLTEIDNSDDLAIIMDSIGNSKLRRFTQLGDMSDLEEAISYIAKAVQFTDDGHSDKPKYLVTLAVSQEAQFKHLGNLIDLENAILNVTKAANLMNDDHQDKPTYLSHLSVSQQTRFDRLGNLHDLDNAISNVAKAAELTDDGDPNKPGRLSSLGIAEYTRFSRLGDLPDLENAISNQERAVELTDDEREHKPGRLTNLGISQRARFQRLGNRSDLMNAISNHKKAVKLTNKHPSQPMYLSNLGESQRLCFEHFGKLDDLEDAISNHAKAVQLTSDGHPSKPSRLSSLGSSQRARFERLGYLADLEDAILNNTKAVELTKDGHPNKPNILLNLGSAQKARFERYGDLTDLENAISTVEKGVNLVDEGHPDRPMHLSFLAGIQQIHFQRIGDLPYLTNAISNQEKVVELTDNKNPCQPMYLLNLSHSQHIRFKRFGDLSDLERVISNREKAVEFTNDGHPDLPMRLSSLGGSQLVLFQRLGNLADLQNAISNNSKAVDLMGDQHPHAPGPLTNLGIAQQLRFNQLRDLSDLENAISNLNAAVELTDDEHPKKPERLVNLGIGQRLRFQYLDNLSDLENAISIQTKAVKLTDGHSAPYLSNLGNSQQIRFERLSDLTDIKNAILNHKKAVDLTDQTDPRKAGYLINLGAAQQLRFKQLRTLEDLLAAVSSLKAAAKFKAAYPRDALSAARKWAELSHRRGDLPSALDGYRTALELLPKVAWLGLDTPSHQDRLLQEKAEDLGCCAASCAIQIGHLEEAVELLDLGRSVFWQQTASLRSDLQVLRDEHPVLAEEFERIGRQIDGGNFSSPSTVGQENTGSYHRNVLEETRKQRRYLVGVWEGLLERVRQLPRFKYFLRPIPFNQLCQASVAGSVVIINASEFGVDALVFGPLQPIVHVPIHDIDLKELAVLSEEILFHRPVVTTEETQRSYTARYLKPTMRLVWNDILVPIFDKLGVPLEHTAAAAERRIWWYPTGPLTFIPIHAAGPGRKGAADVSRLIISSYVTSLNSLLQAQRRPQVAAHRMKLLAISQPSTPSLRPLPQSVTEVEKLVEATHLAALCSEGRPEEEIWHLNGADATVDRVSTALDSCSWIHFACHAFQDPIRGMQSAFALHNGHLSLSEIASKRLSNGQFAFLSACHAASGLEELPGEAMHLAAGVLFAGFPSVIATMWSIRDEDAPKVADRTYRYLFRNGLQGLDPSEAATALNRAILHLREDPNVTMDRWAPFIHFGI